MVAGGMDICWMGWWGEGRWDLEQVGSYRGGLRAAALHDVPPLLYDVLVGGLILVMEEGAGEDLGMGRVMMAADEAWGA